MSVAGSTATSARSDVSVMEVVNMLVDRVPPKMDSIYAAYAYLGAVVLRVCVLRAELVVFSFFGGDDGICGDCDGVGIAGVRVDGLCVGGLIQMTPLRLMLFSCRLRFPGWLCVNVYYHSHLYIILMGMMVCLHASVLYQFVTVAVMGL